MSSKLPDDKILRELYFDQKLTMAQIGSRYGITTPTVHYHFARLGIRAISRRVNLDRGTLHSLYVDSRLTGGEIAKKLGVGRRKVREELVRYGIRRPGGRLDHFASLHSRSEIKKLYIIQGMHQTEAAAKLGISRKMFRRLLTHYRIEHRHRGGLRRVDIDCDKLRQLYIDERRTAIAIAKIFGCSSRTIRDRLQKLGITLIRGRKDPIK